MNNPTWLINKAIQIRIDLPAKMGHTGSSLGNTDILTVLYYAIMRVDPKNPSCFEIGKAITLQDGTDATIIATGETVKHALRGGELLEQEGVSCRVINMHTLKPFDEEVVIKSAHETRCIVTVEEHSIFGGLGAAVAEIVVQRFPIPMSSDSDFDVLTL